MYRGVGLLVDQEDPLVLEFFSDDFFNSEVEPVGGEKAACGNEALAKASTGWCFKQSGVLKLESISHHRKG